MDYKKINKKWEDEKCFYLEANRLMDRYFIFTEFPKANQYGFQAGNVRGIIYADVISRYKKASGQNVVFPLGFHSLGKQSFIENKKISNVLNDEISDVFHDQMINLGIGINNDKLIDLRHSNYISLLQKSFLDLYNKGYIEYKDKEVYYDKVNKKIYDLLYNKTNLNIIKHRCFSLKIKEFIPDILNTINSLDCDDSIKNELTSYLRPRRILKMELSTSCGIPLKFETSEPEFLGALNFIFLNPEFIDITDFVDVSHINNVMRYLDQDSDDLLFSYSGNTCINPLTGHEIPIYISTIYNQDVYYGFSDVCEDDMSLALQSGIEVIQIKKGGKLYNSDFLDGNSFLDARKLIIDSFVEAEMATAELVYDADEIILTSIDSFGPLFPFLEDKDTMEIFSLENYLPYIFSDKLRPVLKKDVDIVGNTLDGTINNLFTEGMIPILAELFDDTGSVPSIFSDEAIKQFSFHDNIKCLLANRKHLLSTVFMPIIFYLILNKENKLNLKIEQIKSYSDVLDINGQEIIRSNNNLLDFSKVIDKFGADSIRLYYSLNNLEDNILFDQEKINEISEDVLQLEKKLMKPSDISYDFFIYQLVKDSNLYLKNNNVIEYAKKVYEFIKKFLANASGINDDDCLNFIKLINPLMPYLAEEIYEERFNNKHSILNEEWDFS